jgi:hypothetical protein
MSTSPNAILRNFGDGSIEVWIHTVLPLHVALEISAMVGLHGVRPLGRPANDDAASETPAEGGWN